MGDGLAATGGDDAEARGDLLSRRMLLLRSLGVATLVFGVEMLPPLGFVLGRRPPSAAEASSGSRFFLFGPSVLDVTSAAPLFASSQTATPPQATSTLADSLAARPIRSPDRRTLALVALEQDATGTTVVVSYVDGESGATAQTGALHLAEVSAACSVLVTPVFAADSTTLCLVISVSSPTRTGMGSKANPATGARITFDAVSWESRHILAYFNGNSATFAGPFDLDDAPSMASVNVAANHDDLFLWTMPEPAALIRASGPTVQIPPPRLAIYGIGSGSPRRSVASPGTWPVNGEPTLALGDGRIVRLTVGTDVEVYQPADAALETVRVSHLDAVGAKPSPVSVELGSDGMLLLSAPGIGRAVVVDPNSAFAAVAEITYPVPRFARGGPTSKVALSVGGTTLYVLGGADTGGIVALAVAQGDVRASGANGDHYSGLAILPSGNILGFAPVSRHLSVFSPDLALLGSAPCGIDVQEIL